MVRDKLLCNLTAHYNSLPVMQSTHDYLCAKDALDILIFAQALGLKISSRCDKAKIYQDNTLLVPFYKGGILNGYQQIYFDGNRFQKRYTGSIGGCSLIYTTSTAPTFIC